MMNISENIQNIHQHIQQLEQHYHRPAGSVKLMVVSKQQNITNIRAAIAAGERCFGESYVQEALPKIAALTEFNIEWHFIGKLQSNKTRQIAQHFHWVDSIDRLVIAERLHQQRPPHLPKLNCCIEVNISQESSKSGVTMDEIYPLAHAISQLDRLSLRGLMVIPRPMHHFTEQVALYQRVIQAQKKLHAIGVNLDILSMGMSDDFAAAIAAGSTMVRIGSAIFGARAPKN